MTPVEFRGDLWRQKTRVPGLSCGVIGVILCSAVLTQYRLVTDGQTDGRTDGRTHDDSIYRASIASHGKKISVKYMLPQDLFYFILVHCRCADPLK